MPDIPWSAWFPVVTLILGFLTKSVSDAVAHGRELKREREARDAERREQLREQRTAFQRQALLELQDAITRLARSTGQVHYADWMAYRRTGKWQPQLVGPDVNDANMMAHQQTMMLRARVADAEVRKLVGELKAACSSIVLCRSPDASDAAFAAAVNLTEAANERIGVVLRQLDEDSQLSE